MKSILKIILSVFCFCVFVLLAGGSDDDNSSKSNDKPRKEQRKERETNDVDSVQEENIEEPQQEQEEEYSNDGDDEGTPSEENAKGQGTGIIVSSDGYIVTNSHVIGDSKTAYKYQVINNDGKKYTANVVGYDTRTDLAVLKIKGKNLKPVHFVKKSHLQVGEDIIAVGNPGGLDFQNSLTKGIVSAKDRTLDDSTVSYIQTDAAVNPGNSGGPLCNLYGEVIGITTAKINSATYEGMGFAIPTDTVETIVNNIIKYGYVENRVRLGIVGVAVDETASTALGIPQGILITEIADDGSSSRCDNSLISFSFLSFLLVNICWTLSYLEQSARFRHPVCVSASTACLLFCRLSFCFPYRRYRLLSRGKSHRSDILLHKRNIPSSPSGT